MRFGLIVPPALVTHLLACLHGASNCLHLVGAGCSHQQRRKGRSLAVVVTISWPHNQVSFYHYGKGSSIGKAIGKRAYYSLIGILCVTSAPSLYRQQLAP